MRGSGIAGRGEKLGAGGREEPRKRKCRGNKIKMR